MNILLISVIVLSLLYSIILFLLLFYWSEINKNTSGVCSDYIKFSVIIPFRNEEKNLPVLINCLINQNYLSENYEVILIDDCSDDNGPQWLRQTIEEQTLKHFKIIYLSDSGHKGKKQALNKGIELAQNEWIITTDADCRVNKNWLSSLAFCIVNNPRILMISAPVCMQGENTALKKFQSLEFTVLNGIGGSLIQAGYPLLCNGANLCFKKSAFFSVEGYSGNENLASGDDIFLMQKISVSFPDSICFLKNPEAIVVTKPAETLAEFFHQRIRWMGKTFYTRPKGIILPAFVWFYHLLTLLSLAGIIFNRFYLIPFSVLFLAKFLSEICFILPVLKFYGKNELIRIYPLTALIYLFYISILPLLSFKRAYSWKGRIVR